MNIVVGILILVVFGIATYYVLFKESNSNSFDEVLEDEIDQFSEHHLANAVINAFDDILQTDYTELNMNKFETLKNERNQAKLRKALKGCSQGNLSDKQYVRDYTKSILQSRLGVNEETICYVITFDNVNNLTAEDKFSIIMYIYAKKYGNMAFHKFVLHNDLHKAIGDGVDVHYEITTRDVNEAFLRYKNEIKSLTYNDYLNIVAQRVYQLAYGLGVIDSIRDMTIDGISCGVSGIPSTFYLSDTDSVFTIEEGELPLTSYNSVWVMFQGKLMHLSFLGFKTQKELERVSKLVYRHNNPGTLDESTGYIVNFMQDGSRVSVARPPFSESWCFFIRKFDAAAKKSIQELYPFEDNGKLIETLHWIVSGCRNVAITGSQFTGKSTLLSNMVQFIPKSFSIRVEEMAFELHLRKLYPRRNIVTFSETATVTGQEGIEFSKKTDGVTSIFGEIAQAAVASLGIQMGQVGARQIIFTHHAKTVKDLVESFRDNMIEAAGYSNEKIVEKTVARVLNFDVHLNVTVDGVRFVERISEIMPKVIEEYPNDLDKATVEYYYRTTEKELFESHDILVFENGRYVFKHELSEYSKQEIARALSDSEIALFTQFNRIVASEVTL